MGTNLSGLALILALGALAGAGYAIFQDRSAPNDADLRLVAIEERLARIEEAAAATPPPVDDGPSLLGRSLSEALTASDPDVVAPGVGRKDPAEPGAAGSQPLAGAKEGVGAGESSERIAEMVQEAVEKKAAEMQAMQNKKPTLEVFADTLELTDLQRQAAEEEVLRGQREIMALLQTPTESGAVFMDEIVDALADNIVNPGQAKGKWARFIGRVLSEKVPGTDETYATRAEAIKDTVRESFRRNWTDKQYATFEAWQMDPTEVQGLEGSPWKDLEGQVLERARELGAEIPDRE